ncbi:UPF0711 protein C18orf21 homolog isoform X1 [Cyprinus carpio]|uniref:UPF0711 protein C18orf21 homolog isoform X1 n=1 Tax=Cyprinus carpio TaxID=7962 RepID=A0A9Q9Z6B4_CYPCA|nr:UPF0711 protein C18orf21 homolog isoform X1 [Cyprinus carpio]
MSAAKTEAHGKDKETSEEGVGRKEIRRRKMATCHTCNKMSRQPGMNRELLSTLSKNRSTPGSAGKQRTPQSASRPTPKSVVDRTPIGTPRSASSNTSSSPSKSGSAKPSPFTRLKKFLMLKNKQQSKKGGLKDFLSSL